jgi:hypothetical protein
MARRMTPDQTTRQPGPDPSTARMDEPLPTANDPGGADAKGYSADPRPEPAVQDKDPIPLAPAPDTQPAIHQPEREGKVQPTGRDEEKDYSPNDRLMGSDR